MLAQWLLTLPMHNVIADCTPFALCPQTHCCQASSAILSTNYCTRTIEKSHMIKNNLKNTDQAQS